MAGQDVRQQAEGMWKAIEAGDWETASQHMHEDFVQEWPQSGERIVGKENALAVDRNYPGGVPRMTIRRATGSGELAVLEVQLQYTDGSVYHGVSVLEFREGKVVKETDYFAHPFEAPQWRAQWVERM